MEVNFFFQEKKNSVIQAKVVQFFTYWNQIFFFGKKIFRNFEFFFLNLRVPGYMEIQKKNFKISENFLSEKKILVPICKKLNNFCLDDGKKRFLEKKICFHKKRQFFFRMEGVTVEELFAYIFGTYIKFGYKDPSILAPSDLVSVTT